MSDSDHIYIKDMAKILGRAIHTIRQWVKDAERMKELTGSIPVGHLEEELWPQREGGRQVFYWTPAQVDGLKAFAVERESRKGFQKVSS